MTERLANRIRERADVLLAFDPGLNQLLIAGGVMIGIAVTIGLVYLFEQAFHGLWIEPPHGVTLAPSQLAPLLLQHHGATILAMLLGGLVAMLAAFTVADTDPRQLTLTMALGPVPLLATMALSIQLAAHRAIGIAAMAVVMGIGVWMPKLTPRIGARAFFLGLMLFVGYLVGFLSRGAIAEDQLGSVAAILWFAAAVNLVLKLLVFVPLTQGALRRTVRAFFARSRGVIRTAAQVFDADTAGDREHARRRLRRRLTRLNEAALIVDGHLASHADIAAGLHERLFATEIAVQNIGRLADALCAVPLPAELRAAIGTCLTQLRDGRDELTDDALAVLVRYGGARDEIGVLEAGRVTRLAAALTSWSAALQRWHRGESPSNERRTEPFESPVTLMFGNLPGSALASSSAAGRPRGLGARLHLDAPAQNAIRMAIAIGAAAALGSVLSERRFYWAVIAVFVAFMGAFTSGEQVIKAFNRVLGTVAGILLGSLLAHAVGASTWSVLVIVLALGIGVYFIRVSYAVMVIGVTVMVSQLYVQLGEYSNHLLVLRLEETAIGAGVAVLAALLVFPVGTRAAARVAAHDFYARLGDLLDGLSQRLDGRPANGLAPSAAARSLDHASQQLLVTARPLSRSPFHREDVAQNLRLFELISHHARNVAADVQGPIALEPAVRAAAAGTLRSQRQLVTALEQHLQRLTAGDRPLDGALIDEVRREGDLLPSAMCEGAGPEELGFLRHVERLDETLAELGDNLSRPR